MPLSKIQHIIDKSKWFGRGVHVVWSDDKLGDALSKLRKSRLHMAIVRDVNSFDYKQDPLYDIKGIITKILL